MVREMKIRNGFVSNSSSASFIIALPEEPDSPNKIKKVLFKGENPEFKCGTCRGKIDINADQICGILYGETLKDTLHYQQPIIGLMELLYYNMDDSEFQCNDDLFEKYRNAENGICHKNCPRFSKCCQKFGSSYNSKDSKKHDVKRYIEMSSHTLDYAIRFVNITCGYKYYLIDCGCQTMFGAFLNEHHKKIFKNIKYIHVSKEC